MDVQVREPGDHHLRVGTADGVNERGLAAHMLYLQATDFGPRDTSMPAVHAGLWAQYLLDNAANVGEASRRSTPSRWS